MILPNNRWIQRLIALANGAAIGFLVDRITHSPLWGLLLGLVSAGLLINSVSRPPLIGRLLKIDRDAGETLRTAAMSLFFFSICAIAALLTLSQ